MNGLIRNIIYMGKNSYREGGFLFWVLLYPLILVMFFHIAFSGILNEDIKEISIGIEEGNPIEQVLEEIHILEVEKGNEDQIQDKLKSDEIEVFIDKDLGLTVNKSGLNQTIVREIVDQVKQMIALNRPLEKFDFSMEHIKARNQRANSTIVIFYTLIAMVSTYAIFFGVDTVLFIQANLSEIGARMNATPIKKFHFIISGLVVAMLLNIFSNTILLLFISYVLKIKILNEYKYSLLLILLGNLFGVCLGVFIGVSNKQKVNIKVMAGISFTLFLSFLSGMMGPHIKTGIEAKLPIMGRINPVNIISSNLYRINLLGSTKLVREGMIVLLAYSIILILASYVFLRRKSYDSI